VGSSPARPGFLGKNEAEAISKKFFRRWSAACEPRRRQPRIVCVDEPLTALLFTVLLSAARQRRAWFILQRRIVVR
jgi:hypothetical protein